MSIPINTKQNSFYFLDPFHLSFLLTLNTWMIFCPIENLSGFYIQLFDSLSFHCWFKMTDGREIGNGSLIMNWTNNGMKITHVFSISRKFLVSCFFYDRKMMPFSSVLKKRPGQWTKHCSTTCCPGWIPLQSWPLPIFIGDKRRNHSNFFLHTTGS